MPTVSPRIEVFGVFDASTGAPVTGGAGGFAFTYYRDDTGVAVSQPTITEIGGGLYKFTPNFPVSEARGVVYMLDLGSGNAPRYYWRYMRREGWDEDKIKTIYQIESGTWKINTSTNKLTFYDADGTTVLFQFDLKDADGNATSENPFQRIAP